MAKKVLSVYLPEQRIEALKALREAENLSVSAMVDRAVRAYLQGYGIEAA